MNAIPTAGPAGIWHVDFEFSTNADGSLKSPFLMAAHHHVTGQTITLWGDELTSRSTPPLPVDRRTIVVCHYCPAEASCFDWLGWPRPHFVDTAVEFRLSVAYANHREEIAMRKRYGNLFKDDPRQQRILKLNGMARALGIKPLYDDEEKHSLQLLAATGGPFTEEEKSRLIAYCVSDVLMTRLCLPHLIRHPRDWARSVLRAGFVLISKEARTKGVPVAVESFQGLIEHKDELRRRVIATEDRWGLYVDGSFSNKAFIRWLNDRAIAWPTFEDSGQPDLRESTFRDMAKFDPTIAEISRLRGVVKVFRGNSLMVDDDGRTRVDLNPFGSKTGRSQPPGSKCLFLMPKFMRKLVSPPPGLAIVQADYSQQEILIAAVLSGDRALLETYMEGDSYVGLGKQLRMIPVDGTKRTHPVERQKCKPLLLGLLYRMTPVGLAARAGISRREAESLHQRLRWTFADYFHWSAMTVATSRAGTPLATPHGWLLWPRYYADNSRTRTNFPIQSTGGDVLRAACLLAADRGLEILMTLHDSILIQTPDRLAEASAATLKGAMLEAAVLVLGDPGEAMRIDLEIIPPGCSPTLDPPDEDRFREVMQWLSEIRETSSTTKGARADYHPGNGS
jgi:hypothetical protein